MRAALGVDRYGWASRYINAEICLSTGPILSYCGGADRAVDVRKLIAPSFQRLRWCWCCDQCQLYTHPCATISEGGRRVLQLIVAYISRWSRSRSSEINGAEIIAICG